MTEGIPKIRKETLIKKAQEKNDNIKRKLHTANKNWNDWNFQLHCNNLEWVNPRNKIVSKNPKKYILNKMIERVIGLAIHY